MNISTTAGRRWQHMCFAASGPLCPGLSDWELLLTATWCCQRSTDPTDRTGSLGVVWVDDAAQRWVQEGCAPLTQAHVVVPVHLAAHNSGE